MNPAIIPPAIEQTELFNFDMASMVFYEKKNSTKKKLTLHHILFM